MKKKKILGLEEEQGLLDWNREVGRGRGRQVPMIHIDQDRPWVQVPKIHIDQDSPWEDLDDVCDLHFPPLHFDKTFSYNELPGPKHCPPPNSKPITYFEMFFFLQLSF